MQQPLPNLGQKVQLIISKVPTPIRVALASWMLISLTFDLGLPSSVYNVPPMMRLIALLPMALLSVGLGVLIFWQGGQTLYRTILFAFSRVRPAENDSKTFRTMGGLGALNIFMAVYYCITFGIAKALETYSISVIFSGLLGVTMIFVLFRRARPPSDVKIFLWSGSLVTIGSGLLMAIVAVPLAT